MSSLWNWKLWTGSASDSLSAGQDDEVRESILMTNVHGMAKLDTAFLQRLIQLGGLLPSFAQSISTFRCFCIEENAINLRI